jgi:ribosomal protein S18 acetylase RimI-like enzyme
MTIDIIPIREDLIEGFYAALDVVCRERIYLAFQETPPIEMTREFVRTNIAKGHPQLVAMEGDRIAGWCDVTPQARATMRHSGVLGIGLLPAYRGRGLGERLIRETIEAARAFGFSRVELSVRHDNVRAQTLYRNVGFQVEGQKRRALLVDGIFYDLVIMALLFDGVGPSGSYIMASG